MTVCRRRSRRGVSRLLEWPVLRHPPSLRPGIRVNQSIITPELPQSVDPIRARITKAWLRDETEAVNDMLSIYEVSDEDRREIRARAEGLVKRVRAGAEEQDSVQAFMQQYDLSSEEGILLMCVAEALLRIPDSLTADRLIRDKLSEADWRKHLGTSHSSLVNASTWSLMLTGKLIHQPKPSKRQIGEHHETSESLRLLTRRLGEPVIRMAVRQAMRIMGFQFVMGRNIKEALKRSREKQNRPYLYAFDMLGEAAFTQAEADRYMASYSNGIKELGSHPSSGEVIDGPSMSVKLSALHPRFEAAKRERVNEELTPRLLKLAQLARENSVALTVDAEEVDRLEISLDVIGAVFADPSLEGWNGLGMVVQAYQKRAPFLIEWMIEQAKNAGRRWCVRLVKGAYWDSEIKRSQEMGLAGYPVYTRKPNSDVCYLACAKMLLDAGRDVIYPQFGTHNAQTISACYQMAKNRNAKFEFQRLHGMGKELYDEVIGEKNLGVPCRVYAPVGSHEELLPYLVRRLLENGANTSFVNMIMDEDVSVDELCADPCETVRQFKSIPHPRIPMPVNLFKDIRKNSMGVNLASDEELKSLADAVNKHSGPWQARPLVPGAAETSERIDVTDPANHERKVGSWLSADKDTVNTALDNAHQAQTEWDRLPVEVRASMLERAADMLEENRAEMIAICVREAGKSISSSVDEVREAADFLRYYATMSRRLMAEPQHFPSPTGETNEMTLHGRGIFICISPWNFPLAIFTGQIAAALVTGNTVIAKPAEQTTLIGYRMAQILHEAGIPEDVLQFVPGDGAKVGSVLTDDVRVAGCVFTGSTQTARMINRKLADRDSAIAALIAETGGQNAMIADSSALPEQLVKDVLKSAFDSAGQRCSACRVLYLQEDVADHIIDMLAGAMDELRIGDPGLISTDVGPVIDHDALEILEKHAAHMDKHAKQKIKEVAMPRAAEQGTFFAPRAYELDSLDDLKDEVFGPVLHVVRYGNDELDKVIDQINSTGYGLTLGIHSRVDETSEYIASRVKVGNAYVNRNQVGAVVGVQPFGGEGLSGTGPKAGGPHYLQRFVTERVLTINTTAAGGNASLLTLGE